MIVTHGVGRESEHVTPFIPFMYVLGFGCDREVGVVLGRELRVLRESQKFTGYITTPVTGLYRESRDKQCGNKTWQTFHEDRNPVLLLSDKDRYFCHGSTRKNTEG
jgi:hypothetical protein